MNYRALRKLIFMTSQRLTFFWPLKTQTHWASKRELSHMFLAEAGGWGAQAWLG